MTAAKKTARKKTAKKAPARKRAPTTETEPPYTVIATEKTADVSAVPVLVPQPHGGALLTGGVRGNVGGGRPKDEVRAAFLGVSQKGAQFLDRLMDGIVDVRFVGTCPHCAQESTPPVGGDLVKLVTDQLAKSVDARLRATDMSARYGLSAKELVIASPQAKAFFDCVHAAIVELAGEDVAAQVQTRAVALMDEARS